LCAVLGDRQGEGPFSDEMMHAVENLDPRELRVLNIELKK
jgi:hypothetical protein